MSLPEFTDWYKARFRRTSSALIASVMVISDLVGVMLSFGTGFFLVNVYNLNAINFKSFVTYWPYLPVFILVFWMFHLYPGISLAPADELRNFTISSLIAHGFIILSRYIEDQEFGAISVALIISLVFSALILMICRSCTHACVRWARVKGIPAVVYGSGTLGRFTVDRLLDHKRMGYVPALILDDNPYSGNFYREVPIIHDTGVGSELVKRFNIKMAIVALPEAGQEELSRLLNYSISAFRYNVLVPDFSSVTNIWMSVRDFDGLLGFATSHKLKMFWNLGIKRFMDLFIVIIGGIVILPFLLFIALLVKITSPGPVLYKHRRIGQNGKEIGVYKFRTMVINAEERLQTMLAADSELRKEWEISYKLKNDPRITKVGKILRRLSFDEFPQLLNVIKGEMSLIGPRPVTQKEVANYGENYNRIFSVKPGMTGLWQVSGRSDTDYNERVSYDTYYLQSWSVWLDLWVLYKTLGVVVKGKGAY
ncbi:undecaprenyl-phosphate galactose phosphotransferase WbaP [Spirochaetia bacterium]|nr:undecaprenyl-phosphate galactose phosphotransferase WbaP [Spirochaetia bacterium]